MTDDEEQCIICGQWTYDNPTPRTREQERIEFDEWYCTHTFDLESEPIGSRAYTQQFGAWLASKGIK